MKQTLSIPDQLTPVLQAARKTVGLTQAELAKRLDLSQSRMSDMEMNPGSIRMGQLLVMFSALNLELVVQPKAGNGEPSAAPTEQEW